jgi:hypothetical protein
MKPFDSGHWAVRAYLHLSYALSLAFVTLAIQYIIAALSDPAAQSDLRGAFRAFGTPQGVATLAVSTAVIALMLYLHLPKMIVRCFTIGRKFGL